MPQEETRKIIQAGHTSLAITLPKGWTRYFELEAGDTLQVISNDELVVRPEKTEEDNRE